MYDVVISGAGPSGSQCAEVIAKAGYNVALIEKNTNWRKPCGGAVHSSVLDLYPQIKKFDISKIVGVVMHSADYHKLQFKGAGNEYSIIMDRLKLDNLMRDAAVDAGADLFDNNISFDLLIKNQKKIGIKTKSPTGIKEYQGNIIVIADGMSSKLAFKSGLRSKWKINELAIGKCAIMEGTHNLDEELVYVYFMPYQGYGWIFPLSRNRFNIGVFTFGSDNSKYNVLKIYQEFITNPHIKNYIPNSNYKIIWKGAYSFPAEGVLEKSLYSDNLMLIGDTGGFVSPISGEGIQTAVVSGKVAAETAIEALQEEDYSKAILKKYRTNLEIKEIIRNFKLKRSMINFFYENKGKNLNKILSLSETDSEFREQVVNMFAYGEVPSKEFLAKVND
ncbi:MAG: NAD(P)/FAD-dependent oxidoreductase [Candidatus Lokiarchaeota archaeon]|nr:NAD(P)/FAD-dependent oxidoreductase [Candidatus Lokiarchaeota archaeon]